MGRGRCVRRRCFVRFGSVSPVLIDFVIYLYVRGEGESDSVNQRMEGKGAAGGGGKG